MQKKIEANFGFADSELVSYEGNEKHIANASDYVNFGQGKPLPKFE